MLTEFEKELKDICIGWIGEEVGWEDYIKSNANRLLEIAVKALNKYRRFGRVGRSHRS